MAEFKSPSASKPVWASKTLWVSVLTAVLGVLTMTGLFSLEVGPEKVEELAGGIAVVLGAVFAVLRYVTKGPVE